MFVPRFHNTFLLKLGILGLIINLTLLPFDAIASDSDSQIFSPDSEIDTTEVSIEETLERQETLRLAAEYMAISSQIWGLQEESQRPVLMDQFWAKCDELKLQLQKNPSTLGLLPLERFGNLHLDILNIPGGREVLRAYRNDDGSSTLQVNQIFASKGSRADLRTFTGVLQAYLEDTGEISAEELNLTAPVDFNIFNGLSPDHQATFFTTYRNADGQNILHLIPREQFDEFADRISDDNLGYLLVSSDNEGIPPLRFYIDSPLSSRLVRLITTPDSDCFNMTELTHLAVTDSNFTDTLQRLRALRVDVDQTDDFGNTAEMVGKAINTVGLPSLLASAYKRADLNEMLWQDIKERGMEYLQTLKGFYYNREQSLYASEFAAAALQTVQSQPQTPLHRAFWQQDTSDSQLVAESKRLWKSFFETYDSIPKDFPDPALPLSGRILNVISNALLDLQETRANIISGASSFGIKFRKATPEEAAIMVRGLYSIASISAQSCLYDALGMHLGQSVIGKRHAEKKLILTSHLMSEGHVDNDTTAIYNYRASVGGVVAFQSEFDQAFERETEVIKNMFFKPYKDSIDTDRQQRLFKHQLKCTVVALAEFGLSCFDKGDNRFAKPSEEREIDSDKIFEYIDGTLKDVMPMGVSARALYKNVKDHVAPDEAGLFSF